MIVNLSNSAAVYGDGNDSIAVVDCFQTIRGGFSLDTTGFTPTVIKSGHAIIRSTTTGQYKPMPVTGLASVSSLGVVTPGSAYTPTAPGSSVTYAAVALTGGTGTGATANITVTGGAVSAVVIVNKGTGYAAGDILSAAAANIGNTGTGFAVTVAAINEAGAYATLPANHVYAGILVSTVLTAKPLAAIMVRGNVNPVAAPYDLATIATALKTALPTITVIAD
jgi:hypothetical protein